MDLRDFDDMVRRAQADAEGRSSLDARLIFAQQLEEAAALTPTTRDGLQYLFAQSALEMQVQVDRCLYASSAWYNLALLCANATRLYGSRDRVYGILWYYCRKANAEAPGERTYYRLIRLGKLLRRWEIEREDIHGLTWRQAYNVLTAAERSDQDASKGDERENTPHEEDRGDTPTREEVLARLSAEKHCVL